MKIEIGSSTINGKPLSTKATTRILIGVFLLVNILLLSVLGIMAAINWKSIYLLFNGTTTNGVVVDFKQSEGTEPSFAAVIEFSVNNQKYTVDTSYYELQPNELGDHLDVVYNPADPSIAQVNKYQERWGVLAIVAGTICPSLILTDLVLLFVVVIRNRMGRKTSDILTS